MDEKLKSKISKKNYESATRYLGEKKESFDRALFHYNMGTLYLRQKKEPIALVHFNKAKSLGMIHPYLRKNLEIVESTVGTPYNFWISGLEFFQAYSKFFFVFLLIIVIQNKNWRKLTSGCLFLLGVMMFTLSPLKLGTVLKGRSIRSGPSKVFRIKNKILPGRRVMVDDLQKGWIHIRYPARYRGWVQRMTVAFD